MIGRPDLLSDPDLPKAAARFARRDEFLAAVRQHTGGRDHGGLEEAGVLLRIPAGPVLDGSTVPAFEQFIEREVFQTSPSGRFVAPRAPYRISGTEPRPFEPAPGNGQHTGTVEWGRGPRSGATETGGSWRLPLDGIRVIDCTAWWAGPAATTRPGLPGRRRHQGRVGLPAGLHALCQHPPPDRGPVVGVGPLFHAANTGKRAITLDLTQPKESETLERLATTADVLVENYTPRVMEQFGLDGAACTRSTPSSSWCACPPSASTAPGGTGPGSPRPWSASPAWLG